MGVDRVVEAAFGKQVRVAHMSDDMARKWVLAQRLHARSVGVGRVGVRH